MPEEQDNVDSQPSDDATEEESYDDVEDVAQIVTEDRIRSIEEDGSVERDASSEDLSEAEEQVIRSARELGVEYSKLKSSLMIFTRRERQAVRSVATETALPRMMIPNLAQQLEHKIINHPTTLGFMIPALGYSEMVLRVGGYGRFPAGPGFDSVLKLSSDTPNCRHQGLMKQLPAVPFLGWRLGREELVDSRVHITDPDGSTCMEISNGSPLGLLLYGRMLAYRNESPFVPTVKIDLGK